MVFHAVATGSSAPLGSVKAGAGKTGDELGQRFWLISPKSANRNSDKNHQTHPHNPSQAWRRERSQPFPKGEKPLHTNGE